MNKLATALRVVTVLSMLGVVSVVGVYLRHDIAVHQLHYVCHQYYGISGASKTTDCFYDKKGVDFPVS